MVYVNMQYINNPNFVCISTLMAFTRMFLDVINIYLESKNILIVYWQ